MTRKSRHLAGSANEAYPVSPTTRAVHRLLADPRTVDWGGQAPRFHQGQVDFIRASLAHAGSFRCQPSRRGKSQGPLLDFIGRKAAAAGEQLSVKIDEWFTFPSKRPFLWMPS